MQQELPRPRLLLHKKPVDVFFELTALACIIFMWAYSIYHYPSLPKNILTHYGVNGYADDYGSKATIFLLPAITTVLILILRLANRYPHKFNYMTVITAENAERQYRMATTLIRYLQFIISIMFTYIVVKTVNDAYLKYSKLGISFLFILMAAIFAPTVYMVYSSLSMKKN